MACNKNTNTQAYLYAILCVDAIWKVVPGWARACNFALLFGHGARRSVEVKWILLPETFRNLVTPSNFLSSSSVFVLGRSSLQFSCALVLATVVWREVCKNDQSKLLLDICKYCFAFPTGYLHVQTTWSAHSKQFHLQSSSKKGGGGGEEGKIKKCSQILHVLCLDQRRKGE